MNLWHELEPGPDPTRLIYVIVEIPKGSRNKYEYSKELGVIKPVGWEGLEAANAQIEYAMTLYREKFGRGRRV
jgi:inorganic pyrophosphatase